MRDGKEGGLREPWEGGCSLVKATAPTIDRPSELGVRPQSPIPLYESLLSGKGGETVEKAVFASGVYQS